MTQISSQSGIPSAVPADSVATLLAGPFGRLQVVRCSGNQEGSLWGATRGYHILVPLEGAFVWHRNAKPPVFVNSTSVLHVEENDGYRVSHPVGAELSAVFWPARSLVEELRRRDGQRDAALPVRSHCDGEMQVAIRRLISMSLGPVDQLAREETTIKIIEQIYSKMGRNRTISPKSLRAVHRAKEYIHDNLAERLSLSEIAAAVGVSPVYLTQLFSASEGVPLYRYHLDLRLNMALDRLPGCDDITRLALDLGFSSHSHFSSEFARRFGISPSQHRAAIKHPVETAASIDGDEAANPATTFVDVIPLCEARGGRAVRPIARHIF